MLSTTLMLFFFQLSLSLFLSTITFHDNSLVDTVTCKCSCHGMRTQLVDECTGDRDREKNKERTLYRIKSTFLHLSLRQQQFNQPSYYIISWTIFSSFFFITMNIEFYLLHSMRKFPPIKYYRKNMKKARGLTFIFKLSKRNRSTWNFSLLS